MTDFLYRPVATAARALTLTLAGALALCLMQTPAVHAQDTFTVTVANKTDEHPMSGQGWPEGYVIDGEQGRELTLTRGVTYTFQLQNVSSIHPFYISESEQGAGVGTWSEGVENNFATGNETLTFTPPESAPDLLYYQCASHTFMGWRINIVSDPTSTEEASEAGPESIRLDQNYPNPFNPSTEISFHLPAAGQVELVVYDALGQEVSVLLDAALPAGSHTANWDGTDNSGQPVPSGTYMYRLRSNGNTTARTMTLIR